MNYRYGRIQIKREIDFFDSSKHMKPQSCCRTLLLYQKIHITYALQYGHEKREMIFYSSKYISSHQVATNVRKIRDQGSNFSHETEGLLASFATIKKINFSSAARKKGQASLDLPFTFLEITF